MSATTTPTYNVAANDLSALDPGLSRLYDNVVAQVPAVGFNLLQLEAWNTIEDFYQRGTARREIVNWQMAAGVSTIDFNPFDSAWLVAWVLSIEGLTFYRVRPPGELMDLTYPASLRQGRALLALKPTSLGAGHDPLLYTEWFETLLSGVLGRLYGMPSKPWTNPELAKFHMTKFNAGVARARDIAGRGYTNGPGRWHYPYFAHGRRKN